MFINLIYTLCVLTINGLQIYFYRCIITSRLFIDKKNLRLILKINSLVLKVFKKFSFKISRKASAVFNIVECSVVSICDIFHFANEAWYELFCNFFTTSIQDVYSQLMNDRKKMLYSNPYYHIKKILMLLNKGNLNNIILPKKIIFSSFDFKLELLEDETPCKVFFKLKITLNLPSFLSTVTE